VFPGDPSGNITRQIAAVITEILDNFKPDIIFDLHESQNVYGIEDHFGNSVLCRSDYRQAADDAVNAINSGNLTPEHPFVAHNSSTEGMISTALSIRFDIPVFTIETTRFEGKNVNAAIQVPFKRRVQQQLFLIGNLLAFYGIQ
jgi:predicted deacylase